MRAAAVLLALLCGTAAADTLIIRGTTPTSAMTLRAANGDSWTCTVSSLSIIGRFNVIRQATFDSMSAVATNCVQTTSKPAPAVGSTSFSKSSYLASVTIGQTYITVARAGTAALTVHWTATGGVTPSAGDLLWAVGDTSPRFVKLTFRVPTTSILTLPGSTATLTVTP